MKAKVRSLLLFFFLSLLGLDAGEARKAGEARANGQVNRIDPPLSLSLLLLRRAGSTQRPRIHCIKCRRFRSHR